MTRQPIVLQLIDSLQIGGAEVMAVNIANALNKRGITSHIVVSRVEGPLKARLMSGVGYLFLDRKKILDIEAVYNFHQYLKKYQINIIHAHATSWFLAVIMKILNPSLKIVWHDHFGNRLDFSLNKNGLIKMGSYFFSAVISVNQRLHQWAVVNLKSDNYIQIPNFTVQLTELSGSSVKLKGQPGCRIVCLANLRPPKDHLNLLKAFVLVHQQFPLWTLHLIGSKSDEVYYQQIQDFIEQHHFRKSVYLYENCANGAVMLSQAEIGVLSSQSEGLPLAILEYGYAKLGVVVTDVGECGEVLENGKNGCLVPPRNPQLLAQKIVFLINHDTERCQMGENLFQKILTNYSEEIIINQLLDIYQQIE